MTRKSVTIITCNRCGKVSENPQEIRMFAVRDGTAANKKVQFDLCVDCMVECLDTYFCGLYTTSTEHIGYKLNIKV